MYRSEAGTHTSDQSDSHLDVPGNKRQQGSPRMSPFPPGAFKKKHPPFLETDNLTVPSSSVYVCLTCMKPYRLQFPNIVSQEKK